MGRRAPTLDIDDILTAALSAGAGTGSDAVLDATGELLGRYGLRRWTMEDVAARAGLARATVYRRFDSRDQLVRATLIRDAGRFFAAVSGAVEALDSLEAKVVEGFVVGLQLVRLSPIPHLLESDPDAARSLLASATFLRSARRALVDSYESLSGAAPSGPERFRVEAVAEALIRLGLSMLATPGLLTGDGTDDDQATMRRALAAAIGPLLAARDRAGERLSSRSAPRS